MGIPYDWKYTLWSNSQTIKKVKRRELLQEPEHQQKQYVRKLKQ